MKNNALSTWSMLLGAVILGSLTASAIGGCHPANPEVAASNTTTDSNVTNTSPTVDGNITVAAETPVLEFADSNVTTADAAPLVAETPLAAAPSSADAEGPAAAEQPAATVAAAAPTPEPTPAPAPAGDTQAANSQAAASDPAAVMAAGGDWPQWGGTSLRNNAPGATDLPQTWNIGKFDRASGEWDRSEAENVRWTANLGSQTYGNPVVADGRVFVGTNNGAGYLPRYPANVDLGCLLAFDEQKGEFLWQHSSEKLITGRVHDWPLQGICAAPLVEGDRLWFVTSRGEVRCLDTQGFHDGEDDGPVTNESVRVGDVESADEGYQEAIEGLDGGKLSAALTEMLEKAGHAVNGEVKVEAETAGKSWKLTGNFGGNERTLTARVAGPRLSVFKALSPADKHEADVVWVFNMMDELGTSQHNMAACSVTAHGDLLFVNTSNGQDEAHIKLPAPEAPSFICMDKNTAEVYWTSNLPGMNILHGQWSSPAVAEIDGTPQVLFAGGDGWLYSFRADRGQDGKPELLWKFDCNPKETKWILGGEGTRNNVIGTPVVYENRVYLAVGQDPEHGEGEGHLWCIDPTKRGDVSPQLAMKVEAGKRVPIEHKRIQAVEPEKGEVAVDNPNSAVIWHYTMFDQNEDGEIDFEEEMHRTIGTVAIKDDVLYVADLSGMFHCLDANGTKDGQPLAHFTYDMFAQAWGSPLIADGHVYIGDEDGDVAVFEFGAENKEPIEEINMGTSIYSTPVAANSTIFISTKDKLFALSKDAE